MDQIPIREPVKQGGRGGKRDKFYSAGSEVYKRGEGAENRLSSVRVLCHNLFPSLLSLLIT